MNKYEYRTESGLVLRLKAVSSRVIQGVLLRVKKDFKERGESIDPPYYIVETLGGEGETEWPNASKNRQRPQPPVSPPGGLPRKACPCDKCLTFPCFFALLCRENILCAYCNAPAPEIAPGL